MTAMKQSAFARATALSVAASITSVCCFTHAEIQTQTHPQSHCGTNAARAHPVKQLEILAHN
eukprot:1223906-Amphidinium_carterae.1